MQTFGAKILRLRFYSAQDDKNGAFLIFTLVSADGVVPAVRTANGRPYNLECCSLETVGSGVPDGPAVWPCVFTLVSADEGVPAVRTANGRPYSLGRTSLESVGTGVPDGPAARHTVSTSGFGEIAQLEIPVILSERSESKDLGSIDGAKILRLRFTSLRMTKTEHF